MQILGLNSVKCQALSATVAVDGSWVEHLAGLSSH